MKHCKATTISGAQCGAYHMHGTPFCFTHNPATIAAHSRAAGKGGMVTKADRLRRATNKLPNKAQAGCP